MASITDCVRGKTFLWTPEANDAFNLIKQKLTSAPLLALPDFSLPFELSCDAFKVGIGVILSQQNHQVAYYSEKLKCPRIRYSTYDVEFYAIVCVVRYWRHYLFHIDFILYTNHDALKHLHSQDSISPRRASWAAYLQQFIFVIKHRSDISNRVADALSRRHLLVADLHLNVEGFEMFRDLYAADPFFSKVFSNLIDGIDLDFVLIDVFLFEGVCLCVPDSSLRLRLIGELHDVDHVGRDRSIELVQHRFF